MAHSIPGVYQQLLIASAKAAVCIAMTRLAVMVLVMAVGITFLTLFTVTAERLLYYYKIFRTLKFHGRPYSTGHGKKFSVLVVKSYFSGEIIDQLKIDQDTTFLAPFFFSCLCKSLI
jgi:hypothetical protein